jgi:hypothetical protein
LCKTVAYVAKGDNGTLFSYQITVDLGNIPITRLFSQSITWGILLEYADRLDGIEKEKYVQLKFHTEESVALVAYQLCCIPFYMHKKVKVEWKRLEDIDVIEKVEDPTP